MKLKGVLAEKANKAQTKEELKTIIEDAGMELSENELDEVSGGIIWSTSKENSLNGACNSASNSASDRDEAFVV